MTQKAYIMHELAGRGYSRFEEVPDEMLDYMPENLEGEGVLHTEALLQRMRQHGKRRHVHAGLQIQKDGRLSEIEPQRSAVRKERTPLSRLEQRRIK